MKGSAMPEAKETHLLPMELRVVQTSESPEFSKTAAAPVSRDLGLGDATRGLFTARRARAGASPRIADIASKPDAWFTFIYVLDGWAKIRVKGEVLTIKAHDAVSQLPLGADTVLALSPGFEFLEIQASDCAAVRKILPGRPRQTIALDSPEAHVLGTGPRSFFDYRNLGVADATDRLIEIQVVRAQKSRDGGTGWHWHNMAQLSYGLSGWAMLDVQGEAAQVRQGPGDALSIPSHWRHNASSFSDDYWALQLQIPADYDTVQDEAFRNQHAP